MLSIFCNETPPRGGVSTVLIDLHDYLIKEKRKFRLHVTKNNNLNYTFKNLHSYTRWLGPFNFIIPLAIELLFSNKIILVDTKAIYSLGIITYIFPFLNNKVTYGFIHGSEIERFICRPNVLRKLFLYKFFYLIGLRNISYVFYLSDFLRNKYSKYFYYYKIKPFFLKYNINYNVQYRKNNIKLKKQNLRFITACRIEEKKGFNQMFHFFESLNKNNYSFIWDIYGSGSYKEVFSSKVLRSCISQYVSFNKPLKHNDLLLRYKTYDFYICLSQYQEGFGLSWYEAGFNGLFLLSTCHGNLFSLENLFPGIYNNDVNKILSEFFNLQIIRSVTPNPTLLSDNHMLLKDFCH